MNDKPQQTNKFIHLIIQLKTFFMLKITHSIKRK